MLDKDPSKRATINDIKNHSWFLNEKFKIKEKDETSKITREFERIA